MEGIFTFFGVIGFLIFIGGFISIFIILGRTGNIIDSITQVHRRVIDMGKEISQLKTELSKLKSEAPILKEEPIIQKQEEIIPPPVFIPEKKEEIVPPTPEPEIIVPPINETITPPIQELFPKEEVPVFKTVVTPPKVSPAKSFFEKNPDLEKFIGENLINKIGIAILVVGIGFFVKFAIDQEWINEIGRVLIGILCGGILVGFAHYTRNSFKAFSSVLVGGGMAIFYLTIAIAFHEYKIIPQTAAFIIMVLITAFSVILAIAYDRKELAVLAIIGGFASPFMVSTGQGNYQVLFSYILILNIGMIILSYFKRWNVVNVLTFVFTILLYGGWLIKAFLYDMEPKPYAGALLFGTIFYIVFFLMNIINNIRENKNFIAYQLVILIANTFLYYSAGMLILKGIQEGIYQGLFTVLVAVFNFLFAFILYRSKKVDNNLVYLLIGLVLTFVTLSAPIQLKGNYITLFWAAESVLLLWLSQKSGIRIMKIGSVITMALSIISLIMDWDNIYVSYDPTILTVIFNKAFAATAMVLVCLLANLLLLKNETEEKIIPLLDKKVYTSVLEIAVLAVSYFGGLLETQFQVDTRIGMDEFVWQATSIYMGCYNLAYVLLLSIYVHFKKLPWMNVLPVVFCIMITISYLSYYNMSVGDVRDTYLLGTTDLAKHYWFHYVNVILLVAILFNSLRIMNKAYEKTKKEYTVFLWFLCFALAFIASAELENAVLMTFFDPSKDLYELKHHNYKVGFPILWGICSFTFMIIGMKQKLKMLRIISLTLFGVALIKMFVFDIQEMSEGGKIAAFISLGVLLLIISFMYQKLKKIIIDKE